MTIRTYIVDDEPPAVEILKTYVERTPGLELLGWSHRPLEALLEIRSLGPDLVLLDADMPDLNGLELAALVRDQSRVIMTTSYPEYAVEAFEKEASDYLLKPIAYGRFLKSIARLEGDHLDPQGKAGGSVFIPAGGKGKLRQLAVGSILLIESAGQGVRIQLPDEEIETNLSLAEMLKTLPNGFVQVHRAYVVNLAAVRTIESGRLEITTGATVPIGRLYRDSLFRQLKKKIIR